MGIFLGFKKLIATVGGGRVSKERLQLCVTLSVRICQQKDSSTFLSWYRNVSYSQSNDGVCLLAMCLIPISSVLALLLTAAGSEGGFLCGVGCGGERGRGDDTDVVVGGSPVYNKVYSSVIRSTYCFLHRRIYG